MKKIIPWMLLCVLALTLLAGCAPAEETVTRIPVTPAPKVVYSVTGRATAVDLLAITARDAAVDAYGTMTEHIQLRTVANEIVSACEARGIIEEDMLTLVRALTTDEELIASVIGGITGDTPLPIDRLIEVFGRMSRILGSAGASRLLYDLTGILCTTAEAYYKSLYQSNLKYEYLEEEIALWHSYADGLDAVGEENFSRLFRGGVTLLTIAGREADTAAFVRGLSACEVQMLLRTEGEMLAGVTADAAGYETLLTFLAYETDMTIPAAILDAGELTRYAELMPHATVHIAAMLTSAPLRAAEAMIQGDISACLHALAGTFDDTAFASFADLLGGEVTAAYRSYFERKALWDAYLASTEGMDPVTRDMLRGAGEDTFLTALTGYIKTESPALGFMLEYGRGGN